MNLLTDPIECKPRRERPRGASILVADGVVSILADTYEDQLAAQPLADLIAVLLEALAHERERCAS